MPKAGGGCAHCGATEASIWYGKKDALQYCKKADCMRAGGYPAPKKLKRARAVAPGAEPAVAELVSLEQSAHADGAWVQEVEEIRGHR
jgi:hypothetical protein